MSTQANVIRPSLASFLDSYPAMEVFELCLPSLVGNLRGEWVTRGKIEKMHEAGAKLPLATLTSDARGRDVEQWVFDSGLGNFKPEITARSPVLWAARPSGQMLMSLSEVDGSPRSYDPRFILQSTAQKPSNKGLTAIVAIEVELHFIVKERKIVVVI